MTENSNSIARPLWSIAGAVLAVGSLGWGTLSIVNLLAHGESSVVAEYAADEVLSLEITNDEGNITVMPTDGDAVTVDARISDGLFATDFDERIVDGVLEITGDCPNFNAIWCEIDMTVSLPSDRPVTIISGDGVVTTRDLTGDLDITGTNGAISIEGASGDLTLRNDNGSVTATDLTSRSVSARNENGSVRLGFVEPPTQVGARSENGNVEVVVPDDGTAYRVDLRTENGGTDNEVVTDPNGSRSIELRTENGNVEVRPR